MQAIRIWSRGDLPDIFNERRERAVNAAWEWVEAEVSNNPESVIDAIFAQYSFKSITFDAAQMTRSSIDARRFAQLQGGFRLIPGQVFTARIPFSGSSELLEYDSSKPDRVGTDSRVQIRGQIAEMQIGSAGAALTESMVQEQIQQFKDDLTRFAGWANADATEYNSILLDEIRREVMGRKRLLDETTRLDSVLDIPIVVVDAESQVEIPMKRKLLRLEEYGALHSEVQYHLSEEIFGSVLSLISSFGRAVERLPVTARKFDEQGIRDIVLFILNANYEGAAAGEVFHGAGRTDILLNHKDKVAFIGEFKFWDGPKSVSDAIDQLCRYTVWRDTKASFFLLIKSTRATTAIKGADKAIQSHPQFSAALESSEPDVRRDYVVISNSDPDRNISLSLLYIVIPKPK
jgi:hypothetical protein